MLTIQLPQHCVTTLCAELVQVSVKREANDFLFFSCSLRTIADRLSVFGMDRAQMVPRSGHDISGTRLTTSPCAVPRRNYSGRSLSLLPLS